MSSASPSFAVARSRITELRAALEQQDREAATLTRRLESVEAETRSVLADKEAEFARLCEADCASLDEQLQADGLLTTHFQDNASSQVVRALIDKQDAGILEEEAALRQRLMVIAERELKKREDEMIAAHESIKANLLKLDEESHSASIQAAYVRHKETIAMLAK